ncbi:hypothetical protein DACRYDRAFT_111098 [Dacryopinax primogenitus]|uniref:Protein kinase domain-containing protein n=1 Tax=Dacryopinax primogenitus (strain DJM 731) TaxID=1858805 RepID=M5FR73_DACPD|nr:uncharacterized protein DACRYDRAFT_111098 [Dacryopinax primogenitus]EJT98118.1 hypothetical protein DACRYDRAFT_111098 [Dacryopinax primogenitus]
MTTYEEYRKQWELDRKEAKTYPLTRGVPLTGTRTIVPYDIPVSTIDVDAALAVLPPAPPVRPRLPPTDDPETVSLTLTTSFQTGTDRWAQVWLATTPQKRRVVVKLFQEALFPRTYKSGFECYASWSAVALSGVEAWGYEQAKALQGLLLPHSYGFYRFELPCRQIVVGLVMEYIEGHSFKRDYEAMVDGSFYSMESRLKREPVLQQLALSVYCLHLCGVHHGDLSVRNIKQLPGPSPFFVFLDFAQCAPYTFYTTWKGKPDCTGLWQCLGEIESSENVVAWVDPPFARGELWAINLINEQALAVYRRSVNAVERP